jgi:alkylation response protein AidB-like acyl-CoA dehydrogenase
MIAAAASYVSGFLSPAAAERWFGPADACLAGQLAPTGRADRVEGGYRVSGRFGFASGSGHATMMIAGCQVFEGGEPARHPNGRPVVRSLIFPPSSCTVLDTWHTTGLWGTGSHDYLVEDLFVAEEDGWDPAGPMHRTEPLFRYPPLFLVPHAGVPLGIARSAIDAVTDLAADKDIAPRGARSERRSTLADDPRAHEAIARAEATLGGARALTYQVVEELWEVLLRDERVPKRLRGMYRVMMTHAHDTGRDVVGSMYDLAASSSIYRGAPLDRHLRDIHTACQHRMVHTRVYGPAGRLLLGLDSGDPLV